MDNAPRDDDAPLEIVFPMEQAAVIDHALRIFAACAMSHDEIVVSMEDAATIIDIISRPHRQTLGMTCPPTQFRHLAALLRRANIPSTDRNTLTADQVATDIGAIIDAHSWLSGVSVDDFKSEA